jgi:predicted acyltransferase
LLSLAGEKGQTDGMQEEPKTTPPATPVVAGGAGPAARPVRLMALDAYRGFVMFLMMAEVLELGQVARAKPDSGWWHFLAHHQSHVAWVGCSLHDMIQPSFSFLVGVALPFSLANRLARGQSRVQLSLHAFWRALVLILLGVFLRSIGAAQTYWTFEDTLTQIGLGYGFLFLLAQTSVRTQWTAFWCILFGYWLAFALYPLPGPGFDPSAVGASADGPGWFQGFAAHWNKNSNLAWAADTHLMNWFPREKPFVFNDGGYSTLSFIPTLGTMLLGVIVGGILRDSRSPWRKVRWLVAGGVIGLAVGLLLGQLGICPVVKRIWTPSWVLFSGGWCLLLTAFFYVVMEITGRKRWAFPLVVIGMNSIAAYCMAHLAGDFIAGSLITHLGERAFQIFGPAYESLLHGGAVLLVFWLILFWLHRQKIYIRI